MSEKLNQLKQILGEVSDLNHAASVLGWDEQVNMPPAAVRRADNNSPPWQDRSGKIYFR